MAFPMAGVGIGLQGGMELRDKPRSLFWMFFRFICIIIVIILSHPFNLTATPLIIFSFILIIVGEFGQDQKLGDSRQDQKSEEGKVLARVWLIVLIGGLVAGVVSDWLIEQINPSTAPPYGKPTVGHALAFVLGIGLMGFSDKNIFKLERPLLKVGCIISRLTGMMLLSNLAIDIIEDYVTYMTTAR